MNLRSKGVDVFTCEEGIVRGAIVFGKVVGLKNERSLAFGNILDELGKENVFAESWIVEVPEVGLGAVSLDEVVEEGLIESVRYCRGLCEVVELGNESVRDALWFGTSGEDEVFDSLLSESCRLIGHHFGHTSRAKVIVNKGDFQDGY